MTIKEVPIAAETFAIEEMRIETNQFLQLNCEILSENVTNNAMNLKDESETDASDRTRKQNSGKTQAPCVPNSRSCDEISIST